MANTRKVRHSFYHDLQQVVIIGIRGDKTVNIKTNVYDLKELQSILSAAMMMSTVHHVKSLGKDIDKLH
jgi:Cys-tRNA synthase (O-phospho-L-seryl-tRNA:Cys-tRNA synthase)